MLKAHSFGIIRRYSLAITIIILLIAGLIGRVMLSDQVQGSNGLFSGLPWLDRTPVTLFFGDSTGQFLVPVSRTFSGAEASPHSISEAVLDGPEGNTGLVNFIPEGTRINSISIKDGIVEIDLSPEFLEADNQFASLALTNSLLSSPGVDRVITSVDGTLIDRSDLGNRLMYYVMDELLIAVPVRAKDVQSALAAFLDGPEIPELVGLPSDVRLLQSDFDPGNGLLSLNFTYTDSVQALGIDYPDTMRQVLIGLIATLTDFPEVQAVTLDFEGHARLGLGQCADLLRAPQIKPAVLNDERLLTR